MAHNATDNDRSILTQKLVDNILDYLHDDSNTLKQCSLVSTLFLQASQRRLFSTFEIKGWVAQDFRESFTPPIPITSSRVANLLGSHTTDLIFVGNCDWYFDFKYANFPKFQSVRRVVFKGESLTLRSLPDPKWEYFSNVQSVEVDFDFMDDNRSILAMLCKLPEKVENISLIATQTKTPCSATSKQVDWFCDLIRETHPSTVHHFSGTLNLNLARNKSHEELLSSMVSLGRVFNFNLKRINHHLTSRADIGPLASLVKECKNTLQFLDIKYSPPCACLNAVAPASKSNNRFYPVRLQRGLQH
jgi:hypothetical protein